MSLELIIVLALLLLFMVGFMFIEPAISKHKVKNNNEYGSARFSNFNEIKRNFKKEKISNIKESGVPIWFSKDYKYVWFDRETPHYTYLGSTGSGKSVTAVIPMCSFIATAKNKRSVFITDPKGEIERKINSLKQLDNTYFTVEQIKSPIGSRFKKVDDELNMSAKDFYKEQREAEEQTLLKAIDQVRDVIKDSVINFEYKTKNNRTFSVISLKKDISEMEKSLIKGQLDTKIYHIEISNNDNGKKVIEIHLKNSHSFEYQIGEKDVRK